MELITPTTLLKVLTVALGTSTVAILALDEIPEVWLLLGIFLAGGPIRIGGEMAFFKQGQKVQVGDIARLWASGSMLSLVAALWIWNWRTEQGTAIILAVAFTVAALGLGRTITYLREIAKWKRGGPPPPPP